MSIEKEFPDFPVADLPAIPAGFVDSSWHNDSCPSFTDEARRLMVYVDYADKEKREEPSAPRFSLRRLDAEGCVTDEPSVIDTDDWNAVLLAIEPKFVRAFSAAGPCLTLGRLTKETAKFYCFEEWRGGDVYSGAKKVAKPLPGKYSGNHIEPCPSCRDHVKTQYPNGYED